MKTLPKRDGLYIVQPHADMIVNGEKKMVIKTKRLNIAEKPLYLLSEDHVLGEIMLGQPKKINLKEFKALRDQHRVTEKEYKDWWSGHGTLWAYKVKRVKPFDPPLKYKRKKGVQVIQDNVVPYEEVRKLHLKEFRQEGIDYDLQHPRIRLKELIADTRYLANSAFPRLLASKKWGDWTLKDVEAYFSSIINTLRKENRLALIPPKRGELGYSSSYWRLYRRCDRKGLIKVPPPKTPEEEKEWKKEHEKIMKAGTTLYAVTEDNKIADVFADAPKFALQTDSGLSYFTNDLKPPLAESLLKICQKLGVTKVVAEKFGERAKSLFSDAGIEMETRPVGETIQKAGDFTPQDVHVDAPLSKERPYAVLGIIIDPEKQRTLLIHRVNKPKVWSPPGGYLDSDKPPQEQVIQEAKEETNCKVKVLKKVGTLIDARDHVDIYAAQYESGEPKKNFEADDIKWFDLDQLPQDISPDEHFFKEAAELVGVKKAGLGEEELKEVFDKLPESFVLIPDGLALTGSAIYARNREPNDIDVISRVHLPAGGYLKLQRALEELTGKTIQFSEDPQGPDWDWLGLYDIVAVKKPEFKIQSVDEPKEFKDKFYKTTPVKTAKAIELFQPIAHYKARGEFYQGEEDDLWRHVVKPALEKGNLVFLQSKGDGQRLHIHWNKRENKFAVMREDGGDRSIVFPNLDKTLSKLQCDSCILDCEVLQLEDGFNSKPLQRWLTAWMASGGERPPEATHIRFAIHDIMFLDGRNLAAMPYLDRLAELKRILPRRTTGAGYQSERFATKVLRPGASFKDLQKILHWAISSKDAQRVHSEGAMVKVAPFYYNPDKSDTWKYKVQIEIDLAIIGYRKIPKGKPAGVHWTAAEARANLKKQLAESNTYILRTALKDKKTGYLLPVEAQHKLTESDLHLTWNTVKQTWEGTDDPSLWTMFKPFKDRKPGEYAFGNSYNLEIDKSQLKPGVIVTMAPMQIRPFKGGDGKWHIAFQHPISKNTKTPDNPIGTVQDALIAHGLDPNKYKPLAVSGIKMLKKKSVADLIGKTIQVIRRIGNG